MQNHRCAWYATLALMLCYALSFVDRQILELMVPQIKAVFGISDTRASLLQGFSFALFYAFMGLLLGRIADFTNRRNLIATCITFWSIFTAACAGARSFASLFPLRTGVGIGEAGLNPAAFPILSDYLFKDPAMVGRSIALTTSIAGTLMLIVFWITLRPYRADYPKMHQGKAKCAQ